MTAAVLGLPKTKNRKLFFNACRAVSLRISLREYTQAAGNGVPQNNEI